MYWIHLPDFERSCVRDSPNLTVDKRAVSEKQSKDEKSQNGSHHFRVKPKGDRGRY